MKRARKVTSTPKPKSAAKLVRGRVGDVTVLFLDPDWGVQVSSSPRSRSAATKRNFRTKVAAVKFAKKKAAKTKSQLLILTKATSVSARRTIRAAISPAKPPIKPAPPIHVGGQEPKKPRKPK